MEDKSAKLASNGEAAPTRCASHSMGDTNAGGAARRAKDVLARGGGWRQRQARTKTSNGNIQPAGRRLQFLSLGACAAKAAPREAALDSTNPDREFAAPRSAARILALPSAAIRIARQDAAIALPRAAHARLP